MEKRSFAWSWLDINWTNGLPTILFRIRNSEATLPRAVKSTECSCTKAMRFASKEHLMAANSPHSIMSRSNHNLFQSVRASKLSSQLPVTSASVFGAIKRIQTGGIRNESHELHCESSPRCSFSRGDLAEGCRRTYGNREGLRPGLRVRVHQESQQARQQRVCDLLRQGGLTACNSCGRRNHLLAYCGLYSIKWSKLQALALRRRQSDRHGKDLSARWFQSHCD